MQTIDIREAGVGRGDAPAAESSSCSSSPARAGLPVLAVLLALVATGASPTSAATLGVDDSSSTGAVGDARLSLSEAIRLAGGQLSPLDLSAAERARIDGDPGASSRDLIRVELGEASILTTPAGA